MIRARLLSSLLEDVSVCGRVWVFDGVFGSGRVISVGIFRGRGHQNRDVYWQQWDISCIWEDLLCITIAPLLISEWEKHDFRMIFESIYWNWLHEDNEWLTYHPQLQVQQHGVTQISQSSRTTLETLPNCSSRFTEVERTQHNKHSSLKLSEREHKELRLEYLNEAKDKCAHRAISRLRSWDYVAAGTRGADVVGIADHCEHCGVEMEWSRTRKTTRTKIIDRNMSSPSENAERGALMNWWKSSEIWTRFWSRRLRPFHFRALGTTYFKFECYWLLVMPSCNLLCLEVCSLCECNIYGRSIS
jgi:hypothetical protein